MIRTEREHRDALKRLQEDTRIIRKQREQMKSFGLKEAQIKKSMEPLISFHLQLKEEVEWYKQVKTGRFKPLKSIDQIGLLLIGVRIRSGLSQKQLAERLSVSEAVVSRDEKNEYHGITVDRAQKILNAMQVSIQISPKNIGKILLNV